MARTPSNMLALETSLPDFSLPDTVSGKVVASTEFADRPLLVAFICNHCPFVKHIRQGLAELGVYCTAEAVGMIAISSNDVASYPDDSPQNMRKEAMDAGYTFPYLYDESQAASKARATACTPDFYLFDREGKLAYRGQLDDSRPGNGVPVTGNDLRAAVAAVALGRAPNIDQKPSIGCNIKWKASGAPSPAPLR